MLAKVHEDGSVVVLLSERNLANLNRPVSAGVSKMQSRVQEDGTRVVVIVEPDAQHYANRPDAMEAYGLCNAPPHQDEGTDAPSRIVDAAK